MRKISKMGGLFARQKAIEKIREIVCAVRRQLTQGIFLVPIMAVFVGLSSCDKKTNGQDPDNKSKRQAIVANDTLNKPKVNVQVNRRYDEKGNLIGFDSTYSSFYSNITGDTVKMDSLMHSFDMYFNRNHSSFFDRQFNPMFFNDSLRYPDFFHKDFFMKRYELNDKYMRETMERMDSIKNHFFFDDTKKRKEPKDL